MVNKIKMTVNNNPFKIHIDLEEEIKELVSENKNENVEEKNLDGKEKKVEILKEEIQEDKNEIEKNSPKESPKEIPKIKVADIVKNGIKGTDNIDIQDNILLKKVEERKKKRKIFKIVTAIFFISLLSGGIAGLYYKKDILASILGVKPKEIVKVVEKTDYDPIDRSQFSPNTKFFYETYIRDYNYFYKNIPNSQYKSKVLMGINSRVLSFIKNDIDYITFRRNYAGFIYLRAQEILQKRKSMNKNKVPLKDGVKVNDLNNKEINSKKITLTGDHLSPEK